MGAWRDPPGLPRAPLLALVFGVVGALHVLLLTRARPSTEPPARLLPSRSPVVALEEVRPEEESRTAGADPPSAAAARSPAPAAKPPRPADPGARAGVDRDPEGREAELASELSKMRADPRAGELARAVLGGEGAAAPVLVFVMGDREKLEVPAAFDEEFLAVPQRDDELRFRIDPRTWTYAVEWDRDPRPAVVHEKDYDRFRSLPPRLAELRKRIEDDPRSHGGLYFFGTRLSELERRLVARRIAAEVERRGRGRRPEDVERVKLRYRPVGKLFDVEVVEMRFRRPETEERR